MSAEQLRLFLKSPWSFPLVPISWVWGRVAAGRRRALAARRAKVSVPVVSVGNITSGGTGKTPVVEMLVRELLRRGRRPAIVSRGYRSSADGLNDESRLLAQNLPGVRQYLNPDRLASGRRAIQDGADVLVLDDGFQQRSLAVDLDIVLLDATDPFGGSRILPAGLLREPLEALGDADLFAITRGSLVPRTGLGILRGLLRDRFPGVPRLEIEMEATGWHPVCRGRSGERAVLDAGALRGKRAAAFAGIGNPEAFRRQLGALGLDVAVWMPFPDHHGFRAADLTEIGRRAIAAGAEVVVMTQKDAVKIPSTAAAGPSESGPWNGPAPWYHLRIAARPSAGGEHLSAAIDGLLSAPSIGVCG